MNKKNLAVYESYYKQNKDYELDLYGYSPPPNGMFDFDGHLYFGGEDFRTEKHFKVYRDCGFNTVLGQTSATYNGEEWETSNAKSVMDKYQKVGIKKFILLDDRLHKLSRELDGGVIGEGKPFTSEKELDEFVRDCLKDYVHHPIFYGVQLVDEPRPPKLKSLGQVYRSIKRVNPNVNIQVNLLPPNFIFASTAFPYFGDFSMRYKAYLNEYLDETGADYFMYDHYPFVPNMEGSILRTYFLGMQISSEVAQERGVEYRIVMQSVAFSEHNVENWRKLSREDMFYQINALLGFGVKQFSYWTYWTKPYNRAGRFAFPENSAIVGRFGNPTDLYYAVQETNAMLTKLAPVFKDFEYVADAHTAKWPCKSRPMFLIPLRFKQLKNVKSFDVDKEVVVISELYDKNKDRYLYRVMNASDPYFGNEQGEQTVTVEFDKKFKYADVFSDGEWKTVELEDGKYQTRLMPGFADYVLVY